MEPDFDLENEDIPMLEPRGIFALWVRIMQAGGIILIVIGLLLLFGLTKGHAYECGDYIGVHGGSAVNPEYISNITIVHDSSEMASGMKWEYRVYIIMNNGRAYLYAQRHYREYVQNKVKELTNILNKCKQEVL